MEIEIYFGPGSLKNNAITLPIVVDKPATVVNIRANMKFSTLQKNSL